MLPPSRLRSGVVSVCVSNPAATRFPPFLLCFESELRDGSFYKKNRHIHNNNHPLGYSGFGPKYSLDRENRPACVLRPVSECYASFCVAFTAMVIASENGQFGASGAGMVHRNAAHCFFLPRRLHTITISASQPACQRASQPVGRQFLIRRSCKFGAEMGDAASGKAGRSGPVWRFYD